MGGVVVDAKLGRDDAFEDVIQISEVGAELLAGMVLDKPRQAQFRVQGGQVEQAGANFGAQGAQTAEVAVNPGASLVVGSSFSPEFRCTIACCEQA